MTIHPVLSSHSRRRQKSDLNDNGSFMKVEKFAECSLWVLKTKFGSSFLVAANEKVLLYFYFIFGIKMQLIVFSSLS